MNAKDGSGLDEEGLAHRLALGSSGGGELQLGSGSGLAAGRGGRGRCCCRRNLGHLGAAGAKERGDAGSAGKTGIGPRMGRKENEVR